MRYAPRLREGAWGPRATSGEGLIRPNASSRHYPAVAVHIIGRISWLLPDYVRDRLGRGSLLLLVGPGRRLPEWPEKQLATLGQNIMFMFPGRIPRLRAATQSGQTYYFTYADYSAIRSKQSSSEPYLRPES